MEGGSGIGVVMGIGRSVYVSLLLIDSYLRYTCFVWGYEFTME